MYVAIEIITHSDDGEPISPPRIMLPDGRLLTPTIGANGFLFIVDEDDLESVELSPKQERELVSD